MREGSVDETQMTGRCKLEKETQSTTAVGITQRPGFNARSGEADVNFTVL